ncbi:MAG: hypothetical protein HY650_11825 [Acidobacteria bacterium]|nr:hypothetical protein [Acidobacteriota bacterium]
MARWAYYGTAAMCVVVPLAILESLTAIPARVEVTQPIAFPHSKHTQLNMDCVSCHTGGADGVHAGIPSTTMCALCHDPGRQTPKTPPELAHYLASGEEIPWQQVHHTPRHVYFSHRRHVMLGNLECAACHGEVKDMEEPFTATYFPQGQDGMNQCVACHNKENVSTDCSACHR